MWHLTYYTISIRRILYTYIWYMMYAVHRKCWYYVKCPLFMTLFMILFCKIAHIMYIHTIKYITSTSSYMCQISTPHIGDDHPLNTWWLRISVQAWRKQISESQLWPGLLLRELPVELSEAQEEIHTGMKWNQKKQVLYFYFQGIELEIFEKKLRFLDFNYFRFQKSGEFPGILEFFSDLWMDFLKFYPIYFHEPWAMANANFSRIKGKMCATNKYPSMSLRNQSFSIVEIISFKHDKRLGYYQQFPFLFS